MSLGTVIARRARRREMFGEPPGPAAVALMVLLAVAAFAGAFAVGRLSHHARAQLPEAAPTSFRVASSHSAIPTSLAPAPPIDLGAAKASPAHRRVVRVEAPASTARSALPTVVPSTPSTAPAAVTPAPSTPVAVTPAPSRPAPKSGGGSHSSSGERSSGGSFDTSG